MTDIAFCLGFRNWHLRHLRRCVKSIRAHTADPIILCDLGSHNLAAIEKLVEPFGVTLVSQPEEEWSRSQALNCAAMSAPDSTKRYVFTDADMIFPGSWFKWIDSVKWDDRTLWLTRSRDITVEAMEFLDKNIDDVPYEDQWLYESSMAHSSMLGEGAAMIVARSWFQKVRGFDEFYKVWGCEDNDLTARAAWDGVDVRWLTTSQPPWPSEPVGAWVAHQWHPRDWPTPEQLAQVRRNREHFYQKLADGFPIVCSR